MLKSNSQAGKYPCDLIRTETYAFFSIKVTEMAESLSWPHGEMRYRLDESRASACMCHWKREEER